MSVEFDTDDVELSCDFVLVVWLDEAVFPDDFEVVL